MVEDEDIQRQRAVEDALISSMPQQKVGYGDNQQHEYYRDRHAYIAPASVPPSNALNEDPSSVTSRPPLLQTLALDSANAINNVNAAYARAVPDVPVEEQEKELLANRILATLEVSKKAQMDPKRANAVAVTEVAAGSARPAAKSIMELEDYMGGTVAARMEKRGVLDFVGDAVGLLAPAGIVNLRETFAAGQFSKTQGGSRFDITKFYSTLHAWNKMGLQQRNAVWDKLEQDLWDASGNNALIYSSLVAPFLDPNDEVWNWIDMGAEVAGSAVGVWGLKLFAVGRLMKAQTVVQRSLRFRTRLMAANAADDAGKVAIAALEKGDASVIVEGAPMTLPKGTSSLTGDMQVPVQTSLLDSMIAKGKTTAEQGLIMGADPADDVARKAFFKRAEEMILTKGNIVAKEEGAMSVKFTVDVPSTEMVSLNDLVNEEVTLTKALKDTTRAEKLALLDAGTAESVDALSKFAPEIERIKARLKTVRSTITKGYKYEGVGTPAARVEVPSVARKEVTLNMSVDDTGQFSFKDNTIGWLSSWMGSGETRAGKLIDGIVAQGTLMRQQQRAIFGMLDKDIKAVQSKIKSGPLRRLFGKDEGIRVDALLRTGDRLGVVYDDARLSSGLEVDGIGFIQFNKRERDAYAAMRDIYDDLYVLGNEMQKRSLTFEGFSEFSAKLAKADGSFKYVPIFAKGRQKDFHFTIPRIGETRTEIVHALDANTGDVVDITKLPTLQSELDKRSKAFLQLRNALIDRDGNHYNWLLVDVEHIGDLRRAKYAREIDKVLPYSVGYVPRITSDHVGWIVEREFDVVRDGVKVRDTMIDRGFESRKEAYIYRDSLLSKSPHSGAKVTDVNTAWRNNPANKEKASFIDQTLFNGAFMGYRSPHGALKIGLDGHEANRISAFEAARRYADFVAAHYPMTEYKASMIRKFLDYARDDSGKSLLEVENDWTSKIINTSNVKSRNVEALQDVMRVQFAVPTSEELGFAKRADQLAYMLDNLIFKGNEERAVIGKVLRSPQRALLSRRWARDPATAIKSLVFDNLLGMFNPAQYFVQSSGMLIPLTLHPLTGVKVMPQFSALRALWRVGDLKDVQKYAKAMGLNGREFGTLWQAFHRSGIADSILENADFGHYIGQQGAYYSPSLLQKMRDNSRIFFNAGELNNRTFSFVMAFNRKADQLGWDLTKALTDKQISEVLAESLRIGVNFTAANSARWQRGWLGIPLQFQQVTHKYIENVIHGMFRSAGLKKEAQWTKLETAAAIGNGLLLWGAAGLGISELFPQYDKWLLDKKDGLGLDPNVPEERALLAAYRGGFLEYMSLKTIGIQLDLSGRTSPAGNIVSPIENILYPIWKMASFQKMMGGDDAVKMLMGASAGIGTRMWRAFSSVVDATRVTVSDGDFTEETLTSALQDISTNLLSIPNSSNQAIQAMLWRSSNKLLDGIRRDTGIAPDGVATSVVVAKALGFNTIDTKIANAQIRREKLRKEDYALLVQKVKIQYRKYFDTEGKITTPAERKFAQQKIQLLLHELPLEKRGEIALQALDEMYGPNGNQKIFIDLIKQIMESTPGSETEKYLMGEMDIANAYRNLPNKE